MECTHGVGIRVVKLDGGEDGVVETLVQPRDGKYEVVRLVRLEGRGDRQVGGRVSIQHVDLQGVCSHVDGRLYISSASIAP